MTIQEVLVAPRIHPPRLRQTKICVPSTLLFLFLLTTVVEAVDFSFVYLDNPEGDFLSRGWLDPDSVFQQNVRAAAAIWGGLIDSQETIRVQVRANRSVLRAGGTFSNGRFLGQGINGNEIFEPGPLSRILTGQNPGAGAEDIDIFLDINSPFIDLNYWLDPSPAERFERVPEGRADMVSIVLEELGHGWGMAGERNVDDVVDRGIPKRDSSLSLIR